MMISKRIEFLQSKLLKGEAALITSPSNRFYYTGFESSDGFLLVTKNTAWFIVDFRYIEKAKSVIKSCNVALLKKLYEQIKDIFNNDAVKTVYLETENLCLDTFSKLKKNLSEFSFSRENKLDKITEKQRSIKSTGELELIKKAQKLTDDTFSYILNNIKAGRTEREIMLDMEFFMRKSGSEGVSFDFIVVSGKNSSLPHGVPTEKVIEKGDFITMDFGAVVGGYRSDMTRTVAVGDISDRQREVYELVLKAQTEAIDYIKPGVICKDVDKVARDLIYSAGYEGCFGHGLGHSVGIDIHEMPACNLRCETQMEKGMIMTVEPGIYIENQFGVRIEDMIVVTDNGCEDLTRSTRDLIIL